MKDLPKTITRVARALIAAETLNQKQVECRGSRRVTKLGPRVRADQLDATMPFICAIWRWLNNALI
jgi:hypothetical protein